MEKLSTIQKRENLNVVYPYGEPGPGGAYHDYDIYPANRKTLFGNVVKKCIQCSRTSEKRNNIVKKFKYSASYFELYTKFTPNEKDFRCGFQISYEP